MRKIYSINEFLDLNEGILSSISSGLEKILGGKKGNIEQLLNKVRNSKMEEINEILEIEKELSKYSNPKSTEVKFQVQNLNKQLRTIVSLKEREVDSYIKDLDRISKNNPKLEALVASELAKIEVEVTREMIRKISPYKDESYLRIIGREFDSLVRYSNETQKELEDEIGPYDYQKTQFQVDPEIVDFVDLDPQKASLYLKNLSDVDLHKIHKDLIDWKLSLEINMDNQTSSLKKKIRRIQKSERYTDYSGLEADLVVIQARLRKPIDKIKSRIQIAEREIKSRKYGNP